MNSFYSCTAWSHTARCSQRSDLFPEDFKTSSPTPRGAAHEPQPPRRSCPTAAALRERPAPRQPCTGHSVACFTHVPPRAQEGLRSLPPYYFLPEFHSTALPPTKRACRALLRKAGPPPAELSERVPATRSVDAPHDFPDSRLAGLTVLHPFRSPFYTAQPLISKNAATAGSRFHTTLHGQSPRQEQQPAVRRGSATGSSFVPVTRSFQPVAYAGLWRRPRRLGLVAPRLSCEYRALVTGARARAPPRCP